MNNLSRVTEQSRGVPAHFGVPRSGEQLLVSVNSDATLCNPGEIVTVMKVEPAPGGFYLHVDGRRELRRFFWAVS